MKTLVILSGGMDSSVALADAIDRMGAEHVRSLTFNYGSKHNDRENRSAQQLAKHYGIPNLIIRMPFINEHFRSDLLKSGGSVPHGHYEDENMTKTVVPFRNGIMLSIAAGLAESLECGSLVLGNHQGDHAIYPDCREDFAKAMSRAIMEGTYGRIELHRPFEKMTKAQIAKRGSVLGIPFELTYSCYEGKEQHCGRCATCIERQEAFEMSGVPDPTDYADQSLYEELKEQGRIGSGPTARAEETQPGNPIDP